MGFTEGLNAGSATKARRDESRRLASAQNAELRSQGFDTEGNVIPGGQFEQKEQLLEQQLKLQSQQLKRMQGAVYAQDTATAIDTSINTGDWTHAQKLLDDNPDLKRAWQGQGVHRVDNINFDTDTNLLTTSEIPFEAYDTAEKRKNLQKKAFKVDTTGKGNWELRTARDVLQTTNISRKLSYSQLNNINDIFRKQITSQQPREEDALAKFSTSYKELVPDATEEEVLGMYAKFNAKEGAQRVTGDLEKFTDGYKKLFPDAPNEQIWEAYNRSKAKEGGDPRTAFQKDTEWLRSAYGDEVADSFVNTRTTWSPTTTTKELNKVEEVKNNLEDKYPAFYETNFKPGTREYRDVERYIQKLEQYLDIKPSEAERKQIADIKSAIALAKSGTKLTEEDTGLIDNLVGNIKKYVSKDAPSGSKAAYSQMMSSIRNALYGATLPAGEMEAYREAYGSLSQQLPAVQTALMPALETLKVKFETIQDTGDEAVTHFRLGASKKEVQAIIDNLDNLMKVGADTSKTTVLKPKSQQGSAEDRLIKAFGSGKPGAKVRDKVTGKVWKSDGKSWSMEEGE